MLQKRWIAGGLCAALVLLAAALGMQQMRMNNLNEQIDSLKTELQEDHASFSNRIDDLEREPAKLVSSYSESFAGLNLQERTVQIKVTIATDQDIQKGNPKIVVNGNGDAGKFDWLEAPLSSNTDGSKYSAQFDLPMDASQMELLLSAGGISEMLQTCLSISDLLPVQLLLCNGDTHYSTDAGDRILYQTEWGTELSDPNVVSSAFRIYKNGKLTEESPCELGSWSYEDANGIAQYWDPADGHATPCKVGDELEMRFVCTDEYGIQYEFPVKRWLITDTNAVVRWPLTTLPTLTWPEKDPNKAN